MSRKVVLLGDIGLDHHGFPPTPVIAGSATVLMDGKPVARQGDPLAPHDKPKNPTHPRAVLAGNPRVLVEGKPIALTGDPVTCGGTLVGSGSGVGG